MSPRVDRRAYSLTLLPVLSLLHACPEDVTSQLRSHWSCMQLADRLLCQDGLVSSWKHARWCLFILKVSLVVDL